MKGIVKWYDPRKGFGFIETEAEGDFFFHINETSSYDVADFFVGDHVEFRPRDATKGQKAVDVHHVKGDDE